MASSRRIPALLQRLSFVGNNLRLGSIPCAAESSWSPLSQPANGVEVCARWGCTGNSTEQPLPLNSAAQFSKQEERPGALTSSGTVCAQRWHHGKRQWPPGMQLWQGGRQRWRSDVACQDNAASPRHEVSSESESIFRYKGPLSQAVKNLKKLSIAGCAASIVGGPILVLSSGDSMPLAAQATIIFTITGFGVFTTSLLHWFTSPYVHSLEYDRPTGNVTVQTLNILGQPRYSSFNKSEAAYPATMRPQVTFEVDGKFYFLDENNFSDKDLLMRLTPPDPSQASTDQIQSQGTKQA